MVERIGLPVAFGQGQQAEDMLDRSKGRCMIVNSVIDDTPGNQRRDDEGRNAHPQLRKVEVVAVIFRVGDWVAGSDGARRRYMVIKTAMFVVGDDQHAMFPVR